LQLFIYLPAHFTSRIAYNVKVCIFNILIYGGNKMYNRILAPVDGSKLAECSLEHVKEVASGCHVSEVILLTVIEPEPFYADYGTQSHIEDEIRKKAEIQKKAKEKAEQYLEQSKENFKKQGITAKSVLIQLEINQSVAEIILDYANNNDIDLIIISSHGRSGITKWAFGSVADRVVRHSRIPVLTIVPAGCRLETA
jgi:nucleotide-binding universal stress UspA family protein